MQHVQHDAVNSTRNEVFIEREFLMDRFSLRAQFDWKVARKNIGPGAHAEEAQTGVPRMFRAASERVFTREGMIDFLIQLRKKAAGHIRTRHASTPQVSVLRKGHHRWIEHDTSIAPWRYMYFMGPRGACAPMVVVLQTREAIREWLPWLERTRTAKVTVGPNDLVMYPSIAVQSVLCHAHTITLEDQTVILSGWLW